MAITIAIASGKGGTGKTTTSANLSVALTKFNKDVIVLDLDIAMANLELVMGLDGKTITLNDVLAGRASIDDAIYEGPNGVKVVPAGISLDGFRKAKPEKLVDVLTKLHSMCDLMILDCPAGIGKEALTAISAAEHLLLLVNPEISSISDALKVIAISKRFETNILGAVINRVSLEDTELSSKAIETILEVPILGMIPEDPNIRRSAAFGEPIVLKYPESPASEAIMSIAAKLVGSEYVPKKTEEKSLIKKFIKGLFGGKK